MERENRYTVLKNKDLTVEQLKILQHWQRGIDAKRLQNNRDPLRCMVIESDWSEYEPAWKAIESRVASCSEESNNSKITEERLLDTCPKCGEEGMEVRGEGIFGCCACGYTPSYGEPVGTNVDLDFHPDCCALIEEQVTHQPFDDTAWRLFFDVIEGRHPALDIPRVQAEVDRLRNGAGMLEEKTIECRKYLNLHHTLAVNEAGIKGILCDALKIEHYQHSLYELSKMVTVKISALRDVADEYDHLIRHMDGGGDFYDFQLKHRLPPLAECSYPSHMRD